MKILKWVVLAVVLLLIVGGLVLYFSLNGIVRSTVQKQTQNQLKVDTQLGSAKVSLFGGSLSLNDFALGSPKGFAAPRLFQLGQASVDVSYGQLRDDPIRIKNVTIQRPVLTIEQTNGQVNIKSLLDQLPPAAQPAGEQKQIRLIIDQLSIANPQVVLRPGIPGLQEQIVIPMQGITLQGVGTGEGNQNGAAIQQVVMEVIGAMADAAAKSDKVPAELRALITLDPSQLASKLGETAGKEMQKVQQQLQKQLPAPATQAIGDVLQKATGQQDPGKAVEKGLGGLMGGLGKKPTTQPK